MNSQEVLISSFSHRISALEKKIFKNKRPPVTMGKKLLLLKETGIIEKVSDLFKTKENLYSFLSICLDEDSANIKKYLNNRPLLEIEENYEFILEMFKSLNMMNFIKKTEDKLNLIKRKE